MHSENGLVAQLDTCLPAGREHQPSKLRVIEEKMLGKKTIMMYFVYVLRSEVNGWFYVGLSENVEKRVAEHNKGRTKSTKGYRPWRLFFFEKFETRNEARSREVYLKSGAGKELIKRKWSGSSVGYLPAGRQGASAF